MHFYCKRSSSAMITKGYSYYFTAFTGLTAPIYPPVSFIHLSGLCMRTLEGRVLMSLKACVLTSEHLRPTAVRATASCWKCKGTLCPPQCVTSFPGPQTKTQAGWAWHACSCYFAPSISKAFLASVLALQRSIWDKWT